jgi:hypothetical protein
MISVPKLVLLFLLAFVAWYAMRWLNRPAPSPRPRQRRGPPPRQSAVEDLTACGTCGAYVAASARTCGKPGCPQPL